MRFQGEEDAQVVDGQVTGRSEPNEPMFVQPAQARGRIYEPGVQYESEGSGIDVTGLVDVGLTFATDKRSRAVALLVKVPLFAYVALSDKVPPLVRLGAALLGAMEVLEAVQPKGELTQIVPEEYR